MPGTLPTDKVLKKKPVPLRQIRNLIQNKCFFRIIYRINSERERKKRERERDRERERKVCLGQEGEIENNSCL